jgi:hypothetical protein
MRITLCPGLQAQKSAVGSCACVRRQQAHEADEEFTTVEPWAVAHSSLRLA